VLRAIESVAMKLGNTRTVCRKCYVHPVILDAYLDGSLTKSLARQAGRTLAEPLNKLSAEETAVLALLKRRLEEHSHG
jgi:DNA topoisomerase-1